MDLSSEGNGVRGLHVCASDLEAFPPRWIFVFVGASLGIWKLFSMIIHGVDLARSFDYLDMDGGDLFDIAL